MSVAGHQRVPNPASVSTRVPVIPLDELMPFCAFLCCMYSCICKQPECMGCYSKDVCCHIQHEVICCKETVEPGFEFICYRSECMTGTCTTLRQSERQFLCMDYRCNAVQTPEQPCLCTALFFTFYYDNQRSCYCCGTVEKLKQVNNRDTVRANNMHQIIEAQVGAAAVAPPAAASVSSQGRSSTGGKQTPIAVATERLPEAVVVFE